MPGMRVVVCPDSIGPLSSPVAADALAAGWRQEDVLLRPSGEAGGGFVVAMAARLGVEATTDVLDGRLVVAAEAHGQLAVAVPGETARGPIPVDSSSAPLGSAVRRLVARYRPERVWVDLVSDDVHDGGAGFRAAVGTDLDGVDLIGVVPDSERRQLLLGLRGITSLRGRANREDPALMLAVDATLAELAESWAAIDQPGAGACGGVGLAVLALGGRLATGPEVTLAGVTGPVDLVVTGCTSYDFASRGGGVVSAAARLATELLCPCVVVAGEVLIGGREMRTMGIEAAYGLASGLGDVTDAGLRALAERVGRSWRW
jgi:glycerate kinase